MSKDGRLTAAAPPMSADFGGDDPPALLIAGPTASGKSALALALARHLDPKGGAEIINADAMQVYRDVCILTARPAPREQGATPHRLYGHIDGACAHSAGAWARDADAAIAACRARGRTPIVVGGAGLYFEALTVGLAATPPITADARAEVDAEIAAAPDAAYALARARDPEAAAAVAPADTVRVRRILEVYAQTGKPLSAWRREGAAPVLAPGAWRAVVVSPPRAELYARIDARVEAMIAAGAADEVAALRRRGLDGRLPVMKAIGVAALSAWLTGEVAQAEAVALMQRDTRRYAKRQGTWIRGRMSAWPRLAAPDVGEARRVLGLE